MPDSQAKYDVEFVEGEFGDVYDIVIKEDDGTLSDISWALYALFEIVALDGTVKASVPNAELTITSATSKVKWDMKSTRTSGYTGLHDGFVTLDNSLTPTRRRITKKIKVFVFDK